MQEFICVLKYLFAHTNEKTNTFFLICTLLWEHSLADSFEHTLKCQETDKVLCIFEASLVLVIKIWTQLIRFNKGITLQSTEKNKAHT